MSNGDAARPCLSLVVATLGRVMELDALLTSLAAQRGPGFEVIIVDQNGDGRLDAMLSRHAAAMPIRHLRSQVRALSHARNLALKLCRGTLVGFPDDDCTYPAGTLARVAAAFASDPALDLLSGAAEAPGGGLGSGRWHKQAAAITRDNVWTTSISFTLFVRRALLERTGGFDEILGVGAPFGAAEETDLVVRAIDAGACARYDPTLRVVHPDKRLTEVAAARAYPYGLGCGYVLGKHRFAARIVGRFLVRPLLGMAWAGIRARQAELRYYWRTFAGRLAGYRAASAGVGPPTA